jgi:hypothetical protein
MKSAELYNMYQQPARRATSRRKAINNNPTRKTTRRAASRRITRQTTRRATTRRNNWRNR